MSGAGRRWVMAIVGVAALRSGYARADDPVTAIRVAYGAPGDCPGSSDFTAQLLRRTALLRLARSDETGVVPLKVTVLRTQRGHQGRLEVTRSDGRVLDREVDGETCDEVVAALALVTALAFDPNASAEPLAPLAEPPPPVAAPAPETKAPPPSHRPTSTPQGTDGSEPSRWHSTFGVALGVRTGATPDPVLVAPVFIGLDLDLPEPFTLSVTAAFERSQTDEVGALRGRASFRWTAAVLEACPVEWRLSAFRAAPCLRFEGGVLDAEGSHILPARSERRPWVSLGPAGRARWSFLGPLYAELGGALMTPLVRDRFYFRPDDTVHRPPLVGVSVRAGLGARIP